METLMLAVCFGYVCGDMLGFIFTMIKWAWDDHKEKKKQAEA